MKRLLKNIQRTIDVFFYNYYLYYTKPVLGESEPISMVIYAMAITFSIPIVSLSMSLTSLLGYDVYWWLHLLLAIPVVIFAFKYFKKTTDIKRL